MRHHYSDSEIPQTADSNRQIASVDEAKEQLKEFQKYKIRGRHPEMLNEKELADFKKHLNTSDIQTFLALDDQDRKEHILNLNRDIEVLKDERDKNVNDALKSGDYSDVKSAGAEASIKIKNIYTKVKYLKKLLDLKKEQIDLEQQVQDLENEREKASNLWKALAILECGQEQSDDQKRTLSAIDILEQKYNASVQRRQDRLEKINRALGEEHH